MVHSLLAWSAVSTHMQTAFDDIAFLATSRNRVTLLEALTDGEPHTRQELMESTDVSRPTLARILDDLEARTWIIQNGQTCRITPLGKWIHEEFTALLETLGDERRLREVVRWFPSNRMQFDVRHLRDARIVLSTETDPMAPIRRAEEVLQTGSQHRMLSYQIACDFFEVIAPRIARGEKRFEGLITPSVYESFLTEATEEPSFQELVDIDTAKFFIVNEIDLILHIVDNIVCFGITDDEHTPRALVVTDHESIYQWADETYESYRTVADPIDPDTVSP